GSGFREPRKATMLKTNDFSAVVTRRGFLGATAFGAASLALAGCSTVGTPPPEPRRIPREPELPDYAAMYAPVEDEGFQIPGIPYEQIDPQFLRQIVDDPTGQPAGTIVVDTTGHFLYLVRPGGQAIRYGVGLGRAGFDWAGNAVV